MSQVLDELRYNESHEWVREEDDGTVTIGITDHAQAQLGDLVYVELPEVGRVVSANDSLGVVE
ncbi:MAG: glycine cleavage system protein H, partial [Gammaproteobacteria bacterium]|nr:glycine cleavage system protein H [Gammaproteobacteria bacterium]